MIRNKKIQRNFIIGDSWLYYKIYTGPKTADAILTKIIKPVTEQLIKDNIIDKWFFIRYADPKHHVRVRLHYSKPKNVAVIIKCLYTYLKEFVDHDLIWKIQIDTYQREMERYGANTIELVEEFFYHDSKMIVDFIDMIEGNEGEELRWLFAMRAIDSQLNSYHYTDEAKLGLLDQLKTGFGNEFGMSRPLKKQLDNKYREERKKIEEFMIFNAEDMPDYTAILDAIKKKEEGILDAVSRTLKHKEEGSLQMELNDLMGSCLHMLMNRLFKSKNRLHELVCYDFLYRYYRSMIAKKVKRTKLKTEAPLLR